MKLVDEISFSQLKAISYVVTALTTLEPLIAYVMKQSPPIREWTMPVVCLAAVEVSL